MIAGSEIKGMSMKKRLQTMELLRWPLPVCKMKSHHQIGMAKCSPGVWQKWKPAMENS